MARAEAAVMWDAGDLEGAEPVLREACDSLSAIGEAFGVATMQALRAWLLVRLGRLDEAVGLIESSTWAWQIPMAAVYWNRARALALAHQGEFEQAIQLGRQAVAMLEGSGDLHSICEENENLAAILALAGDHDSELSALQEAQHVSDEKGCVVCQARVGAALAATQRTPG
jgi:tetratricopeptide (TPR) repeat protein